MARSSLTLAALATAAVAGLDVVSTTPISTGLTGRFDSALLTARGGEQLIIRVPTSQEAETEQSGDLVALRALTTGSRGRLPFRAPEFRGQAPVGQTRGHVYDFIPGAPASLESLDHSVELAESFGLAIAAVHSLPTSVITDAGLPVFSASESVRAATSVKDRAASTGRVPVDLLTRWSLALDDSALWQFQPAVIHGSLGPESFLISGERVTGILDWSNLKVGDPASDLYWLSSVTREESATRVFSGYNVGRAGPVDRQLRKRARLYAELEIAKWLVHGSDLRDAAIVDDAVGMLNGLASTAQADLVNPLSSDTGRVLAVDEVEAMLSQTPRREPVNARDHANAARISDDD
ncbi:phosphotransferase [Subtercola boreus]|uniref:Macrolide 2'-phosphotransferase n=1 Tax=Subtercola boreus TaxID=120213 RepID=A0A3E0WAQ7_9MICO|nr:phosphotransferase [Subtercola boreus]RFA19968.1 macrolide 2'-phosphotransferase [Subtercola boreus]RFA20097.1 macrolide 2'-phosphotransferase [Subtercola boreus]RFA26424.1 macrolide 2'-phosphotransferase [Subtercola boreus]